MFQCSESSHSWSHVVSNTSFSESNTTSSETFSSLSETAEKHTQFRLLEALLKK